MKTIERAPVEENATLESIIKAEIKYLEMNLEAHANEADKFRMKANDLKNMLKLAGIL